MKDLRLLEMYRLPGEHRHGGPGDSHGGVFVVPYHASGRNLRIIASNGDGWDHVSVSLPSRCPTWPEMDHVKRMFFKDDEVAMQLHVQVKDHISMHPHTLHLWRSHNEKIPLPPIIMV
jgi:hypothetical protein